MWVQDPLYSMDGSSVFAHRYLIVAATIVTNTMLSQLNCLCTSTENQLSIFAWSFSAFSILFLSVNLFYTNITFSWSL